MTGFTGYLTLRPGTVERLALSVAGSAESILADGSVAIEEFCLARVIWHGIEHPIQALIVEVAPLLGMSLLRGSELRVEAKDGGELPIRAHSHKFATIPSGTATPRWPMAAGQLFVFADWLTS